MAIEKQYISVSRFILQISLVERLNIHILNSPPDFEVETYKYVSMSKKPIITLKDLKEKRINKYLPNLDYYFYDENIDDIIPDSYNVNTCRESIILNKSLLTSINEIINVRLKK